MRPNPLMPTFTAISCSPRQSPRRSANSHLPSGDSQNKPSFITYGMDETGSRPEKRIARGGSPRADSRERKHGKRNSRGGNGRGGTRGGWHGGAVCPRGAL